MKTQKTCIAAFILSILLCGCNTAPEGQSLESILVPKSTKMVSYDGETVVYEEETKYDHDDIIEREDGLFEVRGTFETSDDEGKIIWLYTGEGTLIGSRSTDSSSYQEDIMSIFDYNIDTYTYLRYDFEEYEDNVIYYEDGSYEEIDIEDGIIVEARVYDSNDELFLHIECNKLGYTESVKYYFQGALNYSATTKYKELSID